ncbi:EF-hand domain-containing protein [Bradyrhizobium nanningense]
MAQGKLGEVRHFLRPHTKAGGSTMLGRTIAAALLVVTLGQPAWAQSPADHQGHHPGQEQEQAPASPQSNSPASPSAERQSPMRGGDMMGMMGRGMMGQGMKGQGGAGGDAMEPPVVFRIIFALMDADGDGTVSLPEFQVAHERIFKAMDRDKDGKLTFEEMMTFMHKSKSSLPQK